MPSQHKENAFISPSGFYKESLCSSLLSSTTAITDANGSLSQHVLYFAYGETFVDEHRNSTNSPYLFNGKEYDEETGRYYYGARYYDPRVSLWIGVDPLAGKYPDISPYIYCLNNPNILKDADGKNPVLAAILGALTEYAGLVGSKMLFEGQSFVDANKSLTKANILQIAISAGTGAATGAIDGGLTKFAKWAANPRNQKIIVKLLEVGVEGLENVLKDYVDGNDVDIKGVLVSTLTDVGLGHLLQTEKIGKIADGFSDNSKAATKRANDLLKRKNPNEKLIKNAKDSAKADNQGFLLWRGLETATDASSDVVSEGLENSVKSGNNEQ